MSAIANLFVGNPVLLIAISAIFFVAWLVLRRNSNLRAGALLVPAVGWLAWAIWEWAIRVFTPEANIRVDLLLILPLILILTGYGIVYLFRGKTER